MTELVSIGNQSLLVVGDMMMDKYIMGTVERISPEAPVPVLQQKKSMRKLGGAGNVIVNAKSLGAAVRAVGRIGGDAEGESFRTALDELGVDHRFLFAEGSTIVKTRVSANNQQFIRIDEETVMRPSKQMMETLQGAWDEIFQGLTVVILSDYAKGFLSAELAQSIIREANKRGIPILADPKGHAAEKYCGATAITPNNKEFLDLTGLSALPDEEGIRGGAQKLCQENDWDYVIFTRAEKGISTISRTSGKKEDYPAVVKEVIDVTGAGDTVITTIALCLGAGFPLSACIKIANAAASLVISKFGAAQTTVAELEEFFSHQRKKALTGEDSLREIERLKQLGRRVVFTNGCFDLVHAGHVSSFHQARSFGDILVVGVNSDASIRRIKGEMRPVVSLPHRMALLSALDCVDFVIPFEEDTPQKLIEQVKPDVLVKGKDWEGKEVAGGAFVRSYGGTLAFVELEQGLSTTHIIEKIKEMLERER